MNGLIGFSIALVIIIIGVGAVLRRPKVNSKAYEKPKR
jgi:hypothetical protein